MKRWFLRRWSKWVAGLVLALVAGGCVKPLYMSPETQHLASTVGLPTDIATNPNVRAPPDVSDHNPPAAVLDSNREPRHMTSRAATARAWALGTPRTGSGFD